MRTQKPKISSTRSRTFFFAFITLCIGLLGCLLALELVLRFLPVSSGLRTLPVTNDNPVLRFEPNREFLWSRDWNFTIVNQGHVNNDGFISNYDYYTVGTPLLAVIGDSYIEATMVPFPQTLQGRLGEKVIERGRIYSFGSSGAPLSQYLAWAAYVRDRYSPSGMVINVVGNDFDESHFKYKQRVSSFLNYVPGEDGSLMLERSIATKRSNIRIKIREFAIRSAIVRYLYFNVGLSRAIYNLRELFRGGSEDEKPLFVGNTAAEAAEERILDSKMVISAFFRDLPSYSGLPPNRILFVVDGMRQALYDPNLLRSAENSYFGKMRQFFITVAREKRYEVIDMHDRFVERYKIDRVRFEFETDYHWNAVGHEVAAEAVENSNLFRDLFELQ